jgi:hypothetical protein
MPITSTGSFATDLGGVQSLKAAMQRRGVDAGILDQVSAASPTGPSEVAPAPTGAPSISAPQVQTPAVTEKTPQAPFRSGEAEIALKALAGVAKIEADIAKSTLQLG